MTRHGSTSCLAEGLQLLFFLCPEYPYWRKVDGGCSFREFADFRKTTLCRHFQSAVGRVPIEKHFIFSGMEKTIA